MAISKNYVTDYGADDTGVTPSTALWTSFKPAAAGQDATLLFPDNGVGHNTYNLQQSGSGLNISWSKGTNSLAVTATGATLTGNVNPLGAVGFLDRGIADVNGVSARIRTVNSGATTVQLTAASAAAGYISRAVVGNWMCVTGFDTQGLFLSPFGVPPNHHFFDYVQITAVGTDTISFTPALTNFYSDQWPCFNEGDAFHVDSAGPASVFFMDSGWNGPVTFTGGTYNDSAQIGCGGRDFTITNGTGSNNSFLMSTNKSYRAYNTSTSALTEHDKLNDYVYIEGGSYGQWHCQSSSNRYLEFKNVSLTILNGSVKNTVLDGCTISGNVTIGPVSYGTGETFRCTNTSISGSISAATAVTSTLPSYVTMANGMLTVPITTPNDLLRIFVPDSFGRNLLFWGTNAARDTGTSKVLTVTSDVWPAIDNQTVVTNVTSTNGSPSITISTDTFTAGDVGKVILIPGAATPSTLRTVITAVAAFSAGTQVITVGDNATVSQTATSRTLQWGTCNIYVQTDDTGGFPASKLISGYTSIRVRSTPVRSVYFENCTGTEQAVDLSQASARNRPYASYTKRTYTGQMPTAASGGNRLSAAGAVAGTGSNVEMIGFIQSLKINIITPYTGTGVPGALTAGLAQFGINLNVNGTSTGFDPRINVKIAGERVFTPGVTPAGLQSGDTLPTLPSGSWIRGGIDPVLSTSVTSEYLADNTKGPVFTIEMTTDQGFSTGPIAVAPLRLRLHT